VLAGTGRRPGWVVGAAIPQLGRSAAWGGDGPLVVEADESDGTFLALRAGCAVVTNVEPDHLENWGGEAALRDGFRRFELRGEADGVTVVDSYDHLPTEVAAALAAAAWGPWRRVVAVFQPHRYSRTAALWRDFAHAFRDADLLAITDVYPAGEAPRPGVSGKLVVDAVLDAHPWAHVAWLPGLDDVLAWLRSVLRPGDLCLTLGAGDLTSLAPQVLEMLEAREGREGRGAHA
jgi:UDP-N-acetylmuramate-alanine ligase